MQVPREQQVTAKNESKSDGGCSDCLEADSGSNMSLWVGVSFMDTCLPGFQGAASTQTPRAAPFQSQEGSDPWII